MVYNQGNQTVIEQLLVQRRLYMCNRYSSKSSLWQIKVIDMLELLKKAVPFHHRESNAVREKRPL